MKFCVLSLFPEIIRGCVDSSILARGQQSGSITITTKNIRDFSQKKNKSVDDAIFGGGVGMLLQCEPVAGAIRSAKKEMPHARVLSLSPQGEVFTQKKAEQLASANEDLILLCGRYEGIDHRITTTLVDEEISLGEYVVSGGEIPACMLIDAVSRLIPGVLGKTESAQSESYGAELFRRQEYPQYTRPEVWEGFRVPQVLLSGNHKDITQWQNQHIPNLEEAEENILRVRKECLPTKTKNLILRMHDPADVPHWTQWVNDTEVTKHLSLSPPLSEEDEYEFYESCQENLFLLPISLVDKHTQKPIGTAGLEIDATNTSCASFGILIGDKNYWGKGVCKEAIRRILFLGFTKLHLESVTLDVFATNIPAQRCYESIGMKHVGEIQKKYNKDGVFHNAFLYQSMREEFLA